LQKLAGLLFFGPPCTSLHVTWIRPDFHKLVSYISNINSCSKTAAEFDSNTAEIAISDRVNYSHILEKCSNCYNYS